MDYYSPSAPAAAPSERFKKKKKKKKKRCDPVINVVSADDSNR